jgi:gliding motility-associated-like protein
VSGAAGTFNPATAGVGAHLITYTTSGACPVFDTLTIRVVNQMVADITETSVTKCKNAADFTLTLSNTSTPGGVWLSLPAGKVDNSGKVSPASAGVGTFRVYYGLQGATITCSAIDSVDITITPIDTAKITTTPAQGPFCLNDPIQNLQKEAASSAGTWSGTGIVSGAAGTFNPTTAGVGAHLITYTTTGACPVFDTLTIRVVNQMVANITTADNTNLCVDNGLYQVVLSGNSTPGGTWSSVPAGLVDNTGKFNPQMAGVSNGVKVLYSVSGATASCSAKDSVLLNVLPREEAQIVDGATKSFCTYDAAFQFTSLNPGGTWSGTGVTAGGLFTPSLAGAGGPYAIKYKVNGLSGLCSDEDTIMVTVIAPTNASINAAGPFCENLGIQQLSAVVPGGTFSGVGVSGSGAFNPAVAGAGTHWIKYTQGGLCPNSDSIQITVEALPQVVITPDVVGGCVPLVVNFGDSSTSSSQVATWTFGDGSSTTVLGADASTSHTYTKVGSFDIWLKMQFLNGCVDSSQSKITVTEVPVADFTFGPNPASTLDPTISFTNQSTGATNYSWNFTSTGTPSTSTNTDEIVSFDPTTASTYGLDTVQVTLKASNAVCTDSIVKEVFIKDVFTLFTPNAFTPNGDGLNESFFPDGLNHMCDVCSNYEFMIFNRWGEMIYRTTTVGDKWNGKRSNTMRDAEIDVYVWKVIYTDSFTGKEGKQIGTVTLMR